MMTQLSFLPKIKMNIRLIKILAVLVIAPCFVTASPLHKAIRDGDVSYLRDLLVNGGDEAVHATIGRGVSPLHLAAALDNVKAAELCLAFGAKVDVLTNGGFTPLHWASSRDAVRCASFLIQRGANISAQSTKGISPLHWAANRNATNVVDLLLLHGADIHLETENGSTPLHWAVMPDPNSAAAQILAYEIVSPEVDDEYTNRLQAVHETNQAERDALEADQAAVNTPRAHPDVYVERDRATARQTLTVNIGLGQALQFEWIEALQLWAGKYEITNAQFRRYKIHHDSLFREDLTLNEPMQPAINVSWNDAQGFCEWIDRTYRDRVPKSFRFRLPTAGEWTRLARCGDNRIYPWGRTWPPEYGNYSDLSAREHLIEWRGIEGYDDGHVVTCDVRESGENPWGLFGMGGNAWEWCQDWFDAEKKYKVRAGGSWDFDRRENLRINAYGFDRPEARYDTIGFRVLISMHATERHFTPVRK
jgi:formylglycine-generating enzyme required for sulfatase activity